MEKEKQGMDNAKEAAQENMNRAKEEAMKTVRDNSLTTKQKVMIGTTVVAAAGVGFSAGYVVGKRKKKEGSEENITAEPKELD